MEPVQPFRFSYLGSVSGEKKELVARTAAVGTGSALGSAPLTVCARSREPCTLDHKSVSPARRTCSLVPQSTQEPATSRVYQRASVLRSWVSNEHEHGFVSSPPRCCTSRCRGVVRSSRHSASRFGGWRTTGGSVFMLCESALCRCLESRCRFHRHSGGRRFRANRRLIELDRPQSCRWSNFSRFS